MSLRARIIVPPASGSVRKVVLTDDYLVASTVSGWVTCLSLRDLFADVDTDLFEHQKVFHADKPWDVDFRDNILATANDNGKIQLWDMQTGYKSSSSLSSLGTTLFIKSTVRDGRLSLAILRKQPLCFYRIRTPSFQVQKMPP